MGRSNKTLFINPKFQLKLIGLFFALSLVTMSIFYGTVVYFFMEFKEIGQNLNLPENHVFYKFLAQQKSKMDVLFAATSFFSLFIFLIGGAVLSHKIAGPVYRLCQFLKDFEKNGKTRPLTFRKGDFFPEIPIHINKALDKVSATDEKKAS